MTLECIGRRVFNSEIPLHFRHTATQSSPSAGNKRKVKAASAAQTPKRRRVRTAFDSSRKNEVEDDEFTGKAPVSSSDDDYDFDVVGKEVHEEPDDGKMRLRAKASPSAPVSATPKKSSTQTTADSILTPTGRSLFGFAGKKQKSTPRAPLSSIVHTPSKLRQVIEKISPTSAKSLLTPASNLRKSSRLHGDSTPTTRMALPRGKSLLTQKTADDTPRTRKIQRKAVVKQVIEDVQDDASESDFSEDSEYKDRGGTVDSDSDNSASDTSGEDYSENGENDNSRINRESMKKSFEKIEINSKHRSILEDEESVGALDKKRTRAVDKSIKHYFQNLADVAQAKKTAKTAGKSLAVALPTIKYAEFAVLNKSLEDKHEAEKNGLHQLHTQHHDQWFFELNSSFNLLCYGLGSKIDLLEEFAGNKLLDGHVVSMFGYDPALQLRSVLLKIAADIASPSLKCGSSLNALSAAIHASYSTPDGKQKLYLVVHNLDGSSMRAAKVQQALALLASAHRIHLIASVDHVQSLLLFTPSTFAQYNFLFHDITTFKSYLRECNNIPRTSVLSSFIPDLLQTKGKNGVTVESAVQVMKSMPDKTKGIFKILASFQNARTDRYTQGSDDDQSDDDLRPVKKSKKVPFESVAMEDQQFFKECKKQFQTSNNLNFRHQLTELQDHQIIVERTLDSETMHYIPLSAADISEVLENM